MSEFKLSVVSEERFDDAFEVLQLVGDAIRAKGRRQRIADIDFSTYRGWQDENANYCVLMKGQIAGLATLRNEQLDDWPQFVELGTVKMLRGLATHPNFHGYGVGRFAVGQLIANQKPAPIYLDCVNDFLPDFYAGLGFELLDKRRVRFGEDRDTREICLMRSTCPGLVPGIFPPSL